MTVFQKKREVTNESTFKVEEINVCVPQPFPQALLTFEVTVNDPASAADLGPASVVDFLLASAVAEAMPVPHRQRQTDFVDSRQVTLLPVLADEQEFPAGYFTNYAIEEQWDPGLENHPYPIPVLTIYVTEVITRQVPDNRLHLLQNVYEIRSADDFRRACKDVGNFLRMSLIPRLPLETFLTRFSFAKAGAYDNPEGMYLVARVLLENHERRYNIQSLRRDCDEGMAFHHSFPVIYVNADRGHLIAPHLLGNQEWMKHYYEMHDEITIKNVEEIEGGPFGVVHTTWQSNRESIMRHGLLLGVKQRHGRHHGRHEEKIRAATHFSAIHYQHLQGETTTWKNAQPYLHSSYKSL